MSTTPTASPPRETTFREAKGWFSRAEAWLDDKGKGAWIVAMVLAFILFWPLGLALLAYLIWSKRMFNSSCASRRSAHGHSFRSSGNTAFDAYKADTLRRLEEEQDAFESFLQRLRDAKDKAEFDQFMEDRAKAARAEADSPEA
jgi:hypothetical protein